MARLAKQIKVKLLKGVIIEGEDDAGRAGDIFVLPRHRAQELVAYGLAVETDEETDEDSELSGELEPLDQRGVRIEHANSDNLGRRLTSRKEKSEGK